MGPNQMLTRATLAILCPGLYARGTLRRLKRPGAFFGGLLGVRGRQGEGKGVYRRRRESRLGSVSGNTVVLGEKVQQWPLVASVQAI